MAVLTVTATERRQTAGLAIGNGISGSVKCLPATVELAAASSSSTILFGYIPTEARILGTSKVYNDDLATSGSPTLDLGLFAVNGNITDNDDVLNNGIALSSANTGTNVLGDIADFGKRAWSIAGESVDPGGIVAVKGTVRDAATTATGTITLELYYTVD